MDSKQVLECPATTSDKIHTQVCFSITVENFYRLWLFLYWANDISDSLCNTKPNFYTIFKKKKEFNESKCHVE